MREENKFQEIGAGGLLAKVIVIINAQLFAALVVMIFLSLSKLGLMPLYSADNLWESEKLKADTSDIGVDVSWREERGLRRKDTKQMQRELTESRQSKQGETWKIESFREA